jgi:hypothetical protein
VVDVLLDRYLQAAAGGLGRAGAGQHPGSLVSAR